MYKFLIFVILLIFIYEFYRRIKYIEEIEPIETFDNQSINKMTYLPSNFQSEYLRDINVKDISKDLGVVRSINQVVPYTDEPIPDDFFKPLDLSDFKENKPIREKAQRPWNWNSNEFK
jgi:hypothetical protein